MRIALFLFLIGALAVGALALVFWRDDAPGRVIEADLAGARFAFARGYARDAATASGGMTDRLSFVASFPDFRPLAARDRAHAQMVVVTVTPKDDGPDPAERPSGLYARFLSADVVDGPGGLLLRRFEPNSPYDLEQLYIAPPDGRSFFARCPKAQSTALGESCLSVFRDGGLDVELRYAPELLERWDALFDGARVMLARMSAAKGAAAKRPRNPMPKPAQ